jgi:hypothetical protein
MMRWLLLAVLGAVACAARDPVEFPHTPHVSRRCGGPGQPECLSCTSCHTLAPGGEIAISRTVCLDCHRGDEQKLRAARGVEDPHTRLAATIRFSHDRHLKLPEVKGQCVGCHSGVVDRNEPRYPPMSRCFDCHEHKQQWERNQCAPCHERADLEKLMPQSFLRHGPGFDRRHGTLARQKAPLCQHCHSQAQCDDCHDVTQDLTLAERRPEQVLREIVHERNFLDRHSIDARSRPAQCLRCHTTGSCDSCHLAHGVSGNGLSGSNPHPPGWIGANPRSPSFHGRAARRDIAACAGCHEQGPATNCIRCHRSGGFGGNPHPGGWKSARSFDSGICRYCHEG